MLLKKINELKNVIQEKNIVIRNLKLWISRKAGNPRFIEDYLEKKRTKAVVIYGMSQFSDLLIEELRNIDVDIKYIVSGKWSVNTYGISFKDALELDGVDFDAVIICNNQKLDLDELNRRNIEVYSIFDILYDKDN